MKNKHLKFGDGFRVLFSNRHAQAAQMTLKPGGCEGGPDNQHRGADQWLYVVAGEGVAIVEGRRIKLREGSLLLIQRGEKHEVLNTGNAMLKTLNFYNPPAYTSEGDELSAGRK